MNENPLRRRIAVTAAQFLIRRQEQDFHKARIRAARQLCKGFVKPDQFPSEVEIRDEIERLNYQQHGDARFDNLQELRACALKFMRRFSPWKPRIVGSALTGDVRSGETIDILFPVNTEADVIQHVQTLMESGEPQGLGTFAIDVEFSDANEEGMSLEDFETLVAREHPDAELAASDLSTPTNPRRLDRFQVYRMLLAPLEQVRQRKSQHPEGDALYHSLQVYELARRESPYDEEVQLAALLHEVGKGIDPHDPVRAVGDALHEYVTPRTRWLIENLPDAKRLLENSLGARARRRLNQHPDYDDLLMLARCDRAGRVPGGDAPSLDEALDAIRQLEYSFG